MGGKHQDYRDAVRVIQALGWRVDTERNGYPMAFCPCKKHKKTIHKTPSDPNYYTNLLAWVARQHRSEQEDPA